MPNKNSDSADDIDRFDLVAMAYNRLLILNTKKTKTKNYVPYPRIFQKFSQAPLTLTKPQSRIVLKRLHKRKLIRLEKNGVVLV